MVVSLYECPNCGPVWRVNVGQEIDTDRDETDVYLYCECCGQKDIKPLEADGKPVLYRLTDEEIEEEMTRLDAIESREWLEQQDAET